MRERFDGLRYEKLPFWITPIEFLCLKDSYRPIRITEDYCPFCKQSNGNFNEEDFKYHQDDNFTVGIRIMKAIEKTKVQLTENNIPDDFKNQVKDIIIDVLFKRFRILRLNGNATELELSKALKEDRKIQVGETDTQRYQPNFKSSEIAKCYEEQKRFFGDFLLETYQYKDYHLFTRDSFDDDFSFNEDALNKIIQYYNKQYKLQGKQTHISQIKTEGLFGYHSYTLDMSEKNLSVIIGTNGLGKTTIFNILEWLFGNDEYLPELFNIPFTRVDIKLCNDGYIRIAKNNDAIMIESKREGGFTGDLETSIKFHKHDTQGNENISAFRKRMEEIIPDIKLMKGRFVYVRTKRLTAKEISGKFREAVCKEGFKNIFQFFNECFKSLYYENDPSKKQCKIDDGKLYIETCKKVFDKEGKFEKVLDFNLKYLPKNKDVRGGDLLELENLSSGEINVLAVLFEIWFMAEPGATILIDEPEISLHIAWQQQMGEIIAEMVKKKIGVQVIVATHSPFLAASTPNSIVEAELN